MNISGRGRSEASGSGTDGSEGTEGVRAGPADAPGEGGQSFSSIVQRVRFDSQEAGAPHREASSSHSGDDRWRGDRASGSSQTGASRPCGASLPREPGKLPIGDSFDERSYRSYRDALDRGASSSRFPGNALRRDQAQGRSQLDAPPRHTPSVPVRPRRPRSGEVASVSVEEQSYRSDHEEANPKTTSCALAASVVGAIERLGPHTRARSCEVTSPDLAWAARRGASTRRPALARMV